jgi:hypothetical protein
MTIGNRQQKTTSPFNVPNPRNLRGVEVIRFDGEAREVRRLLMFEWNDETCWILGRPSFAVAQMAWLLRDTGYKEVAQKAEDEQAVVIYFMLEMYEKHGENWRKEAANDLRKRHEELQKKQAS